MVELAATDSGVVRLPSAERTEHCGDVQHYGGGSGGRSRSGFWPDFAGAIEFRGEDADQGFLSCRRRRFGRADVPFDAADLKQKADDAPGQAFGIGDAVTGQSLAQV